MTTIRVIDLETTDLEPPTAEVCEVGICDLQLENRLIEPLEGWLCEVRSMSPSARAAHHISVEDTKGFDRFDGGAQMFAAHCDAMAAHNASFELKFFTSPVPVICTYKASMRVWPEAPSHTNGALRYWLQDAGKIMPIHDLTMPSHRAGPDAYVTAHILLALFDSGVTGREMVKWTREPVLLPNCPIGKFRGMPWLEIEIGFLRWMVNQDSMENDLKWNAQREIDRRNVT